jgi:hypothetical protein
MSTTYVLHKLDAKRQAPQPVARHDQPARNKGKGTGEALRSNRGFDPFRQLCKGRNNSRAEINAVVD